MTSSLVGSEMCIRDSTPPLRVARSDDLIRTSIHQYPSHIWNASKCIGKPVSYTHLTLPTICSV
eukprot:522304-Prorocentrum_lima.AAC.1